MVPPSTQILKPGHLESSFPPFSTPSSIYSDSMSILSSEYHFPFSRLSPAPGPLWPPCPPGITAAAPWPPPAVLLPTILHHSERAADTSFNHTTRFLKVLRWFLAILPVALKDLHDQALLSQLCKYAPHPTPGQQAPAILLYFGLMHCVLRLWALVQVVSFAWNVLCLLFYISCFSVNVIFSENPSVTV